MDRELHLKLTIRLYTDDNRRCFGPGIATLLERVREHRSLRAAASSMEMAYSKAWRIIRTAEEVFGCKMLDSTTGGPGPDSWSPGRSHSSPPRPTSGRSNTRSRRPGACRF